MCLAFVYKVSKYDKKSKKAIVSLDGLNKEALNAYNLQIRKSDNVQVQMGIIISKLTKREFEEFMKTYE
ncbi:MAG: HypC/HybG/HupF family hydrogenase formation chaperone [bacterium]